MSGAMGMIPEMMKGLGSFLLPPKTPKIPPVEPPPKKPKKEGEKTRIRRKRMASSTVLTSPLGLTGQAPTKKPTLLGE